MNIEVLSDSGAVAEKAASVIADYARDAIASRGRFVMAVSGGHTPWIMLRSLAAAPLSWRAVHVEHTVFWHLAFTPTSSRSLEEEQRINRGLIQCDH